MVPIETGRIDQMVLTWTDQIVTVETDLMWTLTLICQMGLTETPQTLQTQMDQIGTRQKEMVQIEIL
jgi:hypothetical protein